MIYTIGYTGIPLAQLQAFLDAHQALLVDLRYRPLSRNPVYNQKARQAALGGRYVYVGELGNRHYKPNQPMVLVSYKPFNILRTINTNDVSFWACSHPTTLPRWEA